MISKDDFRTLVETIEFQSKKSRQDISVDLGYGKTYISEMLGPRGTISQKFVNQLKRAYSIPLENPKTTPPAKVLKPGNKEITVDEYIDTLKQQLEDFRSLIAPNLIQLRNGQNYILAELKGGIKYRAEIDAKGDPVKLKANLAKASKYAGDYLHSLQEADRKASEGKSNRE